MLEYYNEVFASRHVLIRTASLLQTFVSPSLELISPLTGNVIALF